jgi:hypothetical protein
VPALFDISEIEKLDLSATEINDFSGQASAAQRK